MSSTRPQPTSGSSQWAERARVACRTGARCVAARQHRLPPLRARRAPAPVARRPRSRRRRVAHAARQCRSRPAAPARQLPALTINSFLNWQRCPDRLALAGESGFRELRFEARCPTGIRGTPPNSRPDRHERQRGGGGDGALPRISRPASRQAVGGYDRLARPTRCGRGSTFSVACATSRGRSSTSMRPRSPNMRWVSARPSRTAPSSCSICSGSRSTARCRGLMDHRAELARLTAGGLRVGGTPDRAEFPRPVAGVGAYARAGMAARDRHTFEIPLWRGHGRHRPPMIPW